MKIKLTPAEKQRAYRERQKSNGNSNEKSNAFDKKTVTETKKSNESNENVTVTVTKNVTFVTESVTEIEKSNENITVTEPKKSKINLDDAIQAVANPLEYFTNYISEKPETTALIFELGGKTYNGFLAAKKIKGESVTEPVVKTLADCTMKILHSVVDDSQHDKNQITHYIELYSHREGYNTVRIEANELARLDLFKSALHNNRQIFYGNSNDLDALASYLFRVNPPKIRALSVIGYDDKSKNFVFPKFMYNTDGNRINANGDKYFEAANIKPFMDCSDTVINRLGEMDLRELINQLHTAYGFKGLIALGFYVSSAFSHIVFDHYGFFPFLSLYGDAHAGKSFVSLMLNRCFFVDNEGQTMTAANTVKGELRKISQKSSLVCALLEGRKDKSRFDYDSILPLYNRNALYSRATMSNDNRTHDLHLKASISFVWNHELFASKPAKERVISLHFADKDLNEITSKAWLKLNDYTLEQLASVGHFTLSNRLFFEQKLIKTCQQSAAILKNNGVTVTRIAENHAIALSGIIALLELLKIESLDGIDDITDGLVNYIVARGKNKLETAKSESHLADYFFDSIAELTTTDGVTINANNELVVHLPTVLMTLQQNHNGFNNKAELIAELKAHDRFLIVKNTKALGKQRECYHFKS